MKRSSVFTAIVSAVAICAVVLSSCGDKNQPVSSISDETASNTEAITTEVASSVDITEVDSEEKTTLVSEETTEAVSQTVTVEATTEAITVATTVAENVPDTADEIVAYFNSSANKIKTNAKKVVKNFEKRTVNDDKLVLPESLESVGRSTISTFMKDDTDPIVYETREDITNEFPVPDQSYVSKLESEWVKSASCKDNGDQYVINLKLKDQKNPTAGKGIGAVCDVIEAAEVAEKASFVEKFTTEYYNCEIIATVDKATGNVVHIKYITSVLLELRVNMFGTHDVAVGFTFEKDYSVSY